MKKTSLRLLVLLFVTLSFANKPFAQDALIIKNDLDLDLIDSSGVTVKLYRNSTLRIDSIYNYVRIAKVTDNQDNNKNVGIFEGAELECKDDSVEDLSKLNFKDNTGRWRSDVKGVGSNLERFKKYRVVLNEGIALVSEEQCDVNEDIKEYPNLNDNFSYSSDDRILHVNAKREYKIVVNDIIKVCGINQDEKIHNVDPDDNIRIILSNDNEFFLDQVICVSDLNNYRESGSNSAINSYMLYGVAGCLIAIIVILTWYYLTKKKNVNKTNEMIFVNNERPKAIDVNIHGEVNLPGMMRNVSDVRKQVENVLTKLDSIDEELEKYNKQNKANDLLKTKDSEIDNLKVDIEKLNKKYSLLDETSQKTIKELNNEISRLKQDLEQALYVDGAISLNGTSDFVAKTSELMTIGRKAEQKIADFVSQLNDIDANKFAYFIKQYATSMDAEKRDRWNTILSTLSIKGYINDADAIKYLQAKGCESNEAKIDWLKKFIYQEFLQNYLSSLTVMLESIRFAKKYGLSTNNDVSNEIKQLMSASKNVGIKIHYVELGKDVDDFSNLEISSKLPKGVETTCDKNIPVLVIRYGMSSDKSETKSKTEIVILD